MITAPAYLVDDLRRFAFSPGGGRRVGAEVELIPVDSESRRPVPLESAAGGEKRATLPVLRTHGEALGWRERRSEKAGVPEFCTPEGRITFEPGGQIEFSALPSTSISELVETLGSVVGPLRGSLADAGIDTLTVGVDPLNRIEHVAMQLSGDRYARMARHFATIGDEGWRMMRQTASIQVCLDAGDDPIERWRLLNALVPYVVAIFANSPTYDGEVTGYLNTRRRIWGALDPARTGVFPIDGDPVRQYADFACRASAILLGGEMPPFAPFAEWVTRGVRHEDWRAHLTTLFPEVRPRGYFELRSCDALPLEWYVAPIVFVAGLAYGPDNGRTALEIAGAPNAESLDRAGKAGLDDPAFAERAIRLAELAIRESAALGTSFIDGETIERARDYFDRYTCVRRSPASEQLAPIGA